MRAPRNASSARNFSRLQLGKASTYAPKVPPQFLGKEPERGKGMKGAISSSSSAHGKKRGEKKESWKV